MRYDGNSLAQEHLLDVAKHVVHAVKKAPQITGRLKVQAEVITGEDLLPIMEVMGVLGKASNFVNMDYETFKVNYDKGNPPVLVIIGADTTVSEMSWNCGACGFATCGEFNRYSRENRGMGQLAGGPSCNWKVVEFGMAVDWAAAAAYQYNVDNRVQGSSGGSASLLGYLPECSVIMGLPLGPASEMTWYSRENMNKKLSYEFYMSNLVGSIPSHFMTFPGGGRPAVKTTRNWWEDPHYASVESRPELTEKMYELIEVLSEVIHKHRNGVAEKYSNK
ncbi:MAG: DUF2148 domain-containing protein [Desulfocucumaceae bacterium]